MDRYLGSDEKLPSVFHLTPNYKLRTLDGAMERPAIPAEIRRAVLVEAGHRCAIPTCRYPNIDVHHIVPWEQCMRHDFDNLIALCPNCHRRADSGEIDRKSLRMYKAQLTASFMTPKHIMGEPVTSISESVIGQPGYDFDFEFPSFTESKLKPVSLSLESWGNDLLYRHRADHILEPPADPDFMYGINSTSASFDILRNDHALLSIRYTIFRYYCGAAHGTGRTVTFNYCVDPLFTISLADLLINQDSLLKISALCQRELLQDTRKDPDWVKSGTEPKVESFNSFNITNSGLMVTFDEYKVDCYAAGPQIVEINVDDLDGIIKPYFLRFLKII